MRSFTFALALLLAAVLASVPIAAQGRPAPAKTSAGPAATPLNLNTATEAQLEKLPGVGASTAQRISDYRQKTRRASSSSSRS